MWNLNDYETVEERLEKFWAKYPEGRIETELIEASSNRFIVMAKIYRDAADTKPWATGLAEETVSTKGVNATSALENCESSSLGRCLANAGFAKKGKRPSQSEMGKVVRQTTETISVPSAHDPWTTEAKPVPLLAAEGIVQEIFEDAEAVPNCKHGAMRLKEGNKNNRPYHGYICSNSGSITDVCEALWYELSPSGKWKPRVKK